MAKIAILGEKNYGDRQAVELIMEALPTNTVLVIPTMPGPQQIAEEYAKAHNFPRPRIIAIPTQERTNDEWRQACTERNKQIAKECDLLIAFYCGVDYNVRNLIELVAQLNKPIIIVGNEIDTHNRAHLIDYILAIVKDGVNVMGVR
jgi:hypothetical protein